MFFISCNLIVYIDQSVFSQHYEKFMTVFLLSVMLYELDSSSVFYFGNLVNSFGYLQIACSSGYPFVKFSLLKKLFARCKIARLEGRYFRFV